jgi:outer membrane protein insertion porin family
VNYSGNISRSPLVIAAMVTLGLASPVRGETDWRVSDGVQPVQPYFTLPARDNLPMPRDTLATPIPPRVSPSNNNLPVPIPVTPPQSQIVLAEILVAGTNNPQLQAAIYTAMALEPGRTITRPQLQQATDAVLATGWFQDVQPLLENTPIGIRLTWRVRPYQLLTAVRIEGNQVLPPEVIEQSFADQQGQPINLNYLAQGVEQIKNWYQENGYVLAQVQAPEIQPDGTVIFTVTEGMVQDIQIRYLDVERQAVDVEGNPIEGRTREFIIRREIQLEPGEIFNQQTLQQDLIWVAGLGLFQDVWLDLEPSETDPNQVVVIVNVIEKSTASLVVGGGVNSETGLFGSARYQDLNLGGNNQKFVAEFQVGERLLLFDVSFSDPWIAGDPHRTSYTVNAFRRQGVSLVFEEGERDVRLPNGDRPRLVRTGGRMRFTRPLTDDPHTRPNWVIFAGGGYQRVQITDADGEITPRDDAGQRLTGSRSGEDDLFTLELGIVRDQRNHPTFTTSGSIFQIATQQALPFGSGSLSFNRLWGSYTHYFPVKLFNFVPEIPETIVLNFQAGTIFGAFPPYEAFALGGIDSVRGWKAGALGVGQSFVSGSAEYRFPIFSTNRFAVGGAIFLDAASTLGTQSAVSGNPGERRQKPGEGLGYGAGLRIQSPIGPIQIDYGINNRGGSQIHFGIGTW